MILCKDSIIRNMFPSCVLKVDLPFIFICNIIVHMNNWFSVWCLKVYYAITICQRSGHTHSR